jgi:hypothetical protein
VLAMANPWPPAGNNLLPQDQIGEAPLLFPILEYPTIENNSTTDFSQWLPIPTTFNQDGYHPLSLSQQQGVLPRRPFTTDTVAQLHERAVYNGTNDDNVQSMAPPPNQRKRKAPTLRHDDWEPVKARVIELHITQNRPLREVKEIVEEEFRATNFTAT